MLFSMVDLKIVAVVLGTIGLFTIVANVIPQVESGVPQDVAFGADVTPEELVDAGRVLYEGAAGCLACHAESPGARGPNLMTSYQGEGLIGERCGDRVPEMDCKEYLYVSLVRPQEHPVGDYPPIMPPADRALSNAQIWALVAYLQSLGGEVTVTGADIEETDAPASTAPTVAVGPGEPEGEAVFRQLCIMCHIVDGEGGVLGPPLDGLAGRMSPDAIRAKILDPAVDVTEGYEDMVGIMPPNFEDQMTGEQLAALVAYLSELR